MPKSLPQTSFTADPDSRQQIQQSFDKHDENMLLGLNTGLDVGSENVATEKNPINGSTSYVKTLKALRPPKKIIPQPKDQDIETLKLQATKTEKPFRPARKALEAEDLPRQLDTDFQIADSKTRSFELPAVLPHTKDQRLLDKQLELAASIIARAFCSQRFPLVIPADNFNYLQSKGFENFSTVKALHKKNRDLSAHAKRFAANGGGAIAAISFLLQDSDINAGNIGFSGEKAVAIDTGMYFTPLYFAKRYPGTRVLEKRVWDIHPNGAFERDLVLEHFGYQAVEVRLKDAFHISDDVLSQLPNPSLDSKATRKIHRPATSRKGYRPLNGFDSCFDWRQSESNVEKFLQADQTCRKDLLLQFLISIIVFETGFIQTALNQYKFDELLKQQILNITAQRIADLKKVLFDQNNKIHHELRQLVTAKDLNQALNEHVTYYNKETTHPNFQLNLQACQEKADALIGKLTQPLSESIITNSDQSLPLDLSVDALKKIVLAHYKSIFPRLSRWISLPDESVLLLRLRIVLKKCNQARVYGSSNFVTYEEYLSRLFGKNGNVSLQNLEVLEKLVFRDKFVKKALTEINECFNKLNKKVQSLSGDLYYYLYWLEINVNNNAKNSNLKLDTLNFVKQWLDFIDNNSDYFTSISINNLNHLSDIHMVYNKLSDTTEFDRYALDVVLLNLKEQNIFYYNFSRVVQSFHEFIIDNPAIKRFGGNGFKDIRNILIAGIISAMPNGNLLLYPLNDRLAFIAEENDPEILNLMIRMIATEMQHFCLLKEEQFRFLYHDIKYLKDTNTRQFDLLSQPGCVEFCTEVFVVVRFDVNDQWRKQILSSALHWYGQVDRPTQNDKDIFLNAVKEVSQSTVELQKLCGKDAPVISTPTFMQSTLFKLKYGRELQTIGSLCAMENQKKSAVEKKTPLKLHEDLVRLNQKSREFAFDGKHDASKEAYQCCETTVKLFSKKLAGNQPSFSRAADNSLNLDDYPQLNKHRGFGAFLSGIAHSIVILLTGWNAGLVSKTWRQTLFSETSFQPYKTASTKLVTDINSGANNLLKVGRARG